MRTHHHVDRTRTFLRYVTVTVAATALVLTGAVTHADAAPNSVSTIGAHTGAARTMSLNAGPGIDCTVYVTVPAFTPQSPSIVSTQSAVRCTQPVSFISISLVLMRDLPDGLKQEVGWGSNPPPYAGVFAANAFAEAECVSGSYMSAARVTVIFPAGTVPPFAEDIFESDAGLSIQC